MLEAVMACGFQFKNGAAFVRDERIRNSTSQTSHCRAYRSRSRCRAPSSTRCSPTKRRGRALRSATKWRSPRWMFRANARWSQQGGRRDQQHRPRFVLDASGFGRTLPRLLDLDRPSDFPERAALFVHVQDNIVAGAFDRQKIRIGVHPTQARCLVLADSVLERPASLGVVASRELHSAVPEDHRRTSLADGRRGAAAAKAARGMRTPWRPWARSSAMPRT